MIEGSKSFAKQVMARRRHPDRARPAPAAPRPRSAAALDEFGPPYVVKADGLAGGQGRRGHRTTARAALAHARSGGQVVIEEFLDGPEVSVFALADGVTRGPAAARAGLQAGRRRRHRPEHRRDGRLRAAAAGRRPTWPSETLAEVIEPAAGRAAPPRHPVPRPALRGPGPDRGGIGSSSSTPGSATRRPRSCSTGWPRPLAGLLAAAAAGDLARRRPAALVAGRGGHRGHRRRGLPGRAGDRRPDRRHDRGGTDPGRAMSCTRARSTDGLAGWSRPAAGSSTWSGPARTWPRPAAAAYRRPPPGSGCAAAGTATDIAGGRRPASPRRRPSAPDAAPTPRAGCGGTRPAAPTAARAAQARTISQARTRPVARRPAPGDHARAVLRPGLRVHADPAHRAARRAIGSLAGRVRRCC